MKEGMMTGLPIRVEVPVCAFRPYASREYQDTFPVPSPSSVYGMLLSLLGVPREQKARHRGVDMAMAVAELPSRSKVFRKLRRGSDLENTRPDYQDVLVDLTLWVWLRPGADTADPPLAVRVPAAIRPPHAVTRFGGLSLGESSYLVDVIVPDPSPPDFLTFVLPDEQGFFCLPVWVDHSDRLNTVVKRFRIADPLPWKEGVKSAWFRIGG
jgi:CRISPR-associated protein Cas5t